MAVAVVVANTIHTSVTVIVQAVKVVRKWTLEEVKAYCRGVQSVAQGAFVVQIRVVAIAQTAGDVTANDIVQVVTQVWVKPRREIRVGQTEGRLVDNAVVIERHVVDLVVRREGKRLRTNLKTKSAGRRLRVDITAVVVDPPNGLVTV